MQARVGFRIDGFFGVHDERKRVAGIVAGLVGPDDAPPEGDGALVDEVQAFEVVEKVRLAFWLVLMHLFIEGLAMREKNDEFFDALFLLGVKFLVGEVAAVVFLPDHSAIVAFGKSPLFGRLEVPFTELVLESLAGAQADEFGRVLQGIALFFEDGFDEGFYRFNHDAFPFFLYFVSSSSSASATAKA